MQDDRFDGTDSITVCAMTTDATEAPLFRLAVEPDASNQLREASRLMVDKLTTVPRSKLGERVGRLSDEDMIHLGRAILVFLGLAGPSNTSAAVTPPRRGLSRRLLGAVRPLALALACFASTSRPRLSVS